MIDPAEDLQETDWLRREVNRVCDSAGIAPPRVCFSGYDGGPGFVPSSGTLYLPPSLAHARHARVIIAHEVGHIPHRSHYAREVLLQAAAIVGPFLLGISIALCLAPDALLEIFLADCAVSFLCCRANESRAQVRAIQREIEADCFAVRMGHSPAAVRAALAEGVQEPYSEMLRARLAALDRLAMAADATVAAPARAMELDAAG